MICDECMKNNATIHMTTFVNGQVKTVHICQQCAAKKNKPAVLPGFSFNDLLSAFYENKEAEEAMCDMCGTTLANFQKTGKLGCAQCYSVFESSILPVLKGIHINDKHTGKRPGERVAVDIENQSACDNKKEELRRELKAAISTENFEEAARLRDEIALLEKEASKDA